MNDLQLLCFSKFFSSSSSSETGIRRARKLSRSLGPPLFSVLSLHYSVHMPSSFYGPFPSIQVYSVIQTGPELPTSPPVVFRSFPRKVFIRTFLHHKTPSNSGHKVGTVDVV